MQIDVLPDSDTDAREAAKFIAVGWGINLLSR